LNKKQARQVAMDKNPVGSLNAKGNDDKNPLGHWPEARCIEKGSISERSSPRIEVRF
jgi:hypothetical protein